MTFQEFTSCIITNISAHFPADTGFTTHSVSKNNGLTLDALVIRKTDSNITPSIYLNPYFHRYLEGVSIDDICEDILAVYRQNRLEKNIDLSFFLQFSSVRRHIVPKLIHRKKNAALLLNTPYIPYYDLAVVFLSQVPALCDQGGTILITAEHLSMWNVSVDELYRTALSNAPRLLPSYIAPITDCLEGIVELPGFPDPKSDESQPVMYVMTNRLKFCGAATILYPNLLDELFQKHQKNLLLLPSSIHEFIFLPLSEDELSSYPCGYFSEIIRDVNETVLEDTDFLSDHAYYYHGITKTLEMIT